MAELLLVLFVVVVLWLAMLTVAVAALTLRLRRANRVHPGAPTPAPLVWLYSPTGPARLHRRLRTAVNACGDTEADRRGQEVPAELSVRGLGRELSRQAVALDHALVAAAKLPRPDRAARLRELRAEVRALERLAVRLSAMRSHDGRPGAGADMHRTTRIAELDRRLSLLEEAGREVEAIEAAARSDDPDLLLASIRRDEVVSSPPQPRSPAPRSVP